MKASELISLYERGKRNFRGQNLVNQKFDDRQLSGINLSHADIRGASFINTDLTGANFSCAKAGSTPLATLVRTTLQLILIGLAMSFAVVYCAEIFQTLGRPDDMDNLRGLGLGMVWGISLMPSLCFLIFSGEWIADNFLMVVSCYGGASLSASIVMNFLEDGPSSFEDFGLYLLILIAGIFMFLILLFPLVVLVSTTACLVVQILPYRSTWVSTSFERANLTAANFSNATLGNTNFRAARLETACFYKARNLYPQLFEKTHLAKPKLLAKAITEPETLMIKIIGKLNGGDQKVGDRP